MDKVLINGIFFLVVFVFIFLLEFFVLTKGKKNKKGKRPDKMVTEGLYLVSKFNLDSKKLNVRRLNTHISLINGFIIAFVSTFVSIISDNIGIELGIGFVLLIGLIYSIYEIYGRILKKKYGKE